MRKNVFYYFTLLYYSGHIIVTTNKKLTIMKTSMSIKKMIAFIIMLTLAITTTYAQRRHYHNVRPHVCSRPIVTTVVTRPAVAMHLSNRLSKNDRLEMALAYLRRNPSLSISKYSKMTGLTKPMAEAELDAFAVNMNNPIKMIKEGKKKLYVV